MSAQAKQPTQQDQLMALAGGLMGGGDKDKDKGKKDDGKGAPDVAAAQAAVAGLAAGFMAKKEEDNKAVENAVAPEGFKPDDWNHSLLSCCAAGVVPCLYAFCCPLCLSAQARTDYDNSNCCFNFLCTNPVMMVNIVREGLGISGSCVSDCLITCLCTPCAILRVKAEMTMPIRQKQVGATQDGNQEWGSSCAPQPGLGCLYTFFCPLCANAQARSNYDDSNFLLNCLCATPSLVRNIVREGYNIEGTWIQDCLCGVCCPLCTICQVQREIEARGPKAKSTAPFGA